MRGFSKLVVVLVSPGWLQLPSRLFAQQSVPVANRRSRRVIKSGVSAFVDSTVYRVVDDLVQAAARHV